MNELPYLPDEIVKMVYDYIRPKRGFEFKAGQIFKCKYNKIEITEVKKRPYYNEILIRGKRFGFKLADDEECGFATTIKMTNLYEDMFIDKNNFLEMDLNKTMLTKS
tara:strand:+ start:188 stop:508 length:321 start_codon:yes stop_codon:yes gene_type:complete